MVVDDLLPIDRSHHVLLPKLFVPIPPPSELSTPSTKKPKTQDTLSTNTASLKEVEMWPFILCKALLKLACLSWNESNEIRDFNVIQCLTGWFVQNVDTNGKRSGVFSISQNFNNFRYGLP